jgi:hypothetical protein
MAAGAYAELLAGECLVKPATWGTYGNTNIVWPYRQVSVYSVFGSVGGTNQNAGTCACGFNTLADGSVAADKPGTEPLPVFSLPGSTYSRGVIYGRHPDSTFDPQKDPVLLESRDGRDVYFKTAEFEPWRKRSKYRPEIIGNTGYKTFASGPPIKHGILCHSLRRRLKRKESPNNRDYKGRMSFDFLDADQPVYGQSDWMGHLHPGHYLWTNEGVPEPLLAVRHYEDGGSDPDLDTDGAFKHFLPFCAPMPVYDENGTSMGSYIGYTMQQIFGMGFIHFADATNYVPDPSKPGRYIQKKVFLPDDYRSPINPQTGKRTRQVNHREQFFSLSSHLFMVGDNPNLGSPLVARTRYWWYNDGLVTDQPWINRPYLCGFVDPKMSAGAWDFPIQFNILGADGKPAAPENILIGLEPVSTYLTA